MNVKAGFHLNKKIRTDPSSFISTQLNFVNERFMSTIFFLTCDIFIEI